jgi:glutamyl-tRNA synthetase
MVIARAPEQQGDSFGQPLYNLAVVVDDIDMAITHVIRGEDHIANTAKQILLYEAMGATVPEFAHTPLILNAEGRKLSKRDGVTSIDDFRKMGFVAPALANYMTLLGWTPPDATQEIFTLSQAAEVFSLDRVNRAGAKFDWDKLDWINSQYLHGMSPGELVEWVVPYWQKAGYSVDLESDRPWLEQLTALIAPSLTRLSDAPTESRLLLTETVDFTEAAIAHLQQEGVKPIIEAMMDRANSPSPLDLETAKTAINQVTKAQGVKKGMVMKALRAGLMGDLQGPDLLQSWLLLHQKGWDKVRLKSAIAYL